ncbi:MAG TPA: beta-glucosidase [Stellaceae bacterium]|nr:beta-glucosidase [Stellaceae bacterium]
MTDNGVFRSFFLGGFECSTQRRRDGRRLDLLEATGHDRLAADDYRLLHDHGIRTMRDGLRWHRIETAPGRYDWSSFLPMLQAARAQRMQVIWDLCHYGWPDDLDIWSPSFVDRFARFAGAVARLVREESDDVPFYCPINEISFWAWAAGDAGKFAPAAHGRGGELKRQLVRAAIAAIEAIAAADPRARIAHADPLINVLPASDRRRDREAAAGYHLAQYEARDMLAGRLAPELGGAPDHLGLVGVNFYSDNQWVLGGPTVEFGNPRYRPLSDLLIEVWRRYERPIFLAETGAEGSARPAWLFYVCSEVRAAMAAGVPIEGICLYPVLDYPGWENERHCDVGLLCRGQNDARRVCAPLAEELRRQQAIFAQLAAERTALGSPRLGLAAAAD